MADRQLVAKRVRMALGAGAFRSRDEAAAKISAELGYEISREILRKTEEGLRGAELELLDAIATVCGVEREFVRGDEYVFVPNDVRDLSTPKGLSLNPDDHNKWQDWALMLKSDHLAEDLNDYGFDHNGRLVHKSWLYTDPIDLQVEQLFEVA